MKVNRQTIYPVVILLLFAIIAYWQASFMIWTFKWDMLDVVLPWRYHVGECLQNGNFPFWNPYQGLGQPLLSNGFSALFYPPNWLRLLLPPAWWDMVYLVNWFLAALFLYLYLRFMGVGKGPALVGAAAIFSNGYLAGLLALR